MTTQIIAKPSAYYQVSLIMDIKGMIGTVSMGNNSNKNSQIKILKSHAHLCIIGRKSKKIK